MAPLHRRARWLDTAGTLISRGLVAALLACGDNGPNQPTPAQLVQGRETFRFDTFGDETFWTDTFRMHEIIESGVSPTTALAVGLKVDADALPPGLLQSADLNSPATTVALLKLNAYGLSGVNSVTYTGDGDRPAYWNRYVAVTQMHGHGSFSEPRLSINVSNPPDQVEAKLPNLEAYQLSLAAPAPPPDNFDAAATRGQAVFSGPGQCSTCHAGATFTDANTTLHPPAEVPTDPTHAARSATKMYRTTPLRGLWQHAPYFHDGSAATLADVVDRYDSAKNLQLTPEQKADLVEYLNSF